MGETITSADVLFVLRCLVTTIVVIAAGWSLYEIVKGYFHDPR